MRREEDDVMKYRPIMLFNAACLVLFMVFLNGCASQIDADLYSNEWIARPLSELKQDMRRPDSYASKQGWKETTYSLANGNYVFVEPIAEDCFVDWEINSGGIIIGYQSRGKGCKQKGVFKDLSVDQDQPGR